MDRTESNLRDKLSQSGYPDELIEDAVAYVKSYGYLDDRRYAENFVRYHGTHKSRRRVYQDLIKKGMDREQAALAVEEAYEGDEAEQIASLLKKRGYDPETADPKERQRTFSFLLRRGFDMQEILHAMKAEAAE